MYVVCSSKFGVFSWCDGYKTKVGWGGCQTDVIWVLYDVMPNYIRVESWLSNGCLNLFVGILV
jgi:hypothetical protein